MKHIKDFGNINESSSPDDALSISKLIKILEDIRNEKGDINCCFSIDHEYWGAVEHYLTESSVYVSNAQPEGPKSGVSEDCVVFSSYF